MQAGLFPPEGAGENEAGRIGSLVRRPVLAIGVSSAVLGVRNLTKRTGRPINRPSFRRRLNFGARRFT
jgi:hypothetical protein